MTDTTTTTPPAKRGGVILTDRHCEKRVASRVKIYDRKCPGLYVSIIPAGAATFNFKFTDREVGRQRTVWLGVYNPETFTVEDARSKAYGLKAMGGDALAETFREQKAKAKQGKTLDEIIAERIEWMKASVLKEDGEKRARIEGWKDVASHLQRFISPRLGKKIASDVTKHDIAELSNDIVTGKHGGKPSIANARHMRVAASGLFNWAAEAGRNYVSASPCVNLPKLDKEHPRTRVLTPQEIRIFWHGLDRDDLPSGRKTRLALKFELVTMLRSGELLGARRDELFDLDGDNPRFDVPLKRVKKRRVIQQPLSDLAVEIIREALADGKEHVFASPLGDQPMHRKVMAAALHGTKPKGGKVKSRGICALLGLKPFTPHDLRRTAATLAGDLGFDDAWIAKALDHAASKKQEQTVPSVTGKVYNHSKRMKEKRAVLDGVAAELRRIIGEQDAEADIRVAA